MSGTLLVPVQLDALLLASDEAVVEAAADFARLPYTDGVRDANPDTANLSEEIVSLPFADQNLYLKPGVHLHWALPDTLTHATQSAGATDFPAVPNRWLVVRSRDGGATVESRRVVESDYLWPEGQGADAGAISVPVAPDPAAGLHRPYRYQGRNVPLELWPSAPPAGAGSLDLLTAVGYGETNFASVYPNCRSVFGLLDPIGVDEAAGARYDLLGWFDDAADDRLQTFVRDYTVPVDAADPGGEQRAPTLDELRAGVEEELKWRVPEGVAEFPDRILCYARVDFDADARPVEDAATVGAVEIALASSGIEALSAYLAGRVAEEGDKGTVEDQLESLQLLPRLEHRALDVGANLREGRHERGFAAVRGGTVWTVRGEGPPAAADAAQGQDRRDVVLPPELASALNEANRLQQAYDAACEVADTLRQQAFADWYHAMLCAYPPPDSKDDYPDLDEARHYLEAKSIPRVTEAAEAAGTLSLGWNADGTLAGATGAEAGSRAAELGDALAALLLQVATLNRRDDVVQAGLVYALRDAPGPRFWEPREPVVLLSGPPVRPTDRHGGDGVLECDVFAGAAPEALIPARVDEVLRQVDSIQAARGAEAFGFRAWTAQPWHPLLLQWEVEVLPVAAGGNLDPDDPEYAPDHLSASFTLLQDEPDLSLRPGEGALSKAANVYTGSTLLTPAAAEVLTTRLQEYLEDPSTDTASEVATHLRQAHDLLASPDFYALSQSLGGFNQALLMRRQTRQLEVADPLGFAADGDFAGEVRDAVGDETRSAPQPLWDFNPLRTGALRVLRLRLVDTFGRVRELDCSAVVTTELLRTAEDPSLVWLPPRLVPPARLDFRWLSAADGTEEIGDAPLDSPVCGWFVPDNLDGSLLVYDAAGAALGMIGGSARWEAPGASMLDDPARIANPHLNRAVAWLLEQGADFFAPFLDTVDSALENIDPESYAQHADLALLMGRPFALARATLRVEIQGGVPVHQGWSAFRKDLARTGRETDAVERVRVPLRVGEHGQLNDGVVGYWVEEADGTYQDGVFFAPQSDAPRHEGIRTSADDPAPLSRCLDEPPLTLAILVDPHGVVHATSGIVPVQELSVPPEQYTDALAALEVVFLTTPLLTDAGALNLPLPAEPGFRWSWLGEEGAALGRALPDATFAAAQEVREGWLRLTPDPTDTGTPDES
jgi:hypothetical protein